VTTAGAHLRKARGSAALRGLHVFGVGREHQVRLHLEREREGGERDALETSNLLLENKYKTRFM